jgi:ubiquinone/menaquinone biosynthesis C-methylase UbiE
MKWFALRKSSHEQLEVSMAGIKLGDRLLVVGCSHPMLLAQLAVKTGLTGRAFAVDEHEPSVTSAAAIAAREGALVETATTAWRKLPLDTDSFDVAIVRDVLPHLAAAERSECLREVRRVLRAGGRCLIIDGKGRGRGGGGRHGSAAADYASEDAAVRALSAEGFKAARILAERDGLRFAEAVKPNAER